MAHNNYNVESDSSIIVDDENKNNNLLQHDFHAVTQCGWTQEGEMWSVMSAVMK